MDEGSYEARKSAPGERVEVTVRAERRRRWSAEELRIVRETLRPGAVAQVVADRNGIGTGQLYTWRKQMLTAAITGFATVETVSDRQSAPLLTASSVARDPLGAAVMEVAIEVELPNGARCVSAAAPARRWVRCVCCFGSSLMLPAGVRVYVACGVTDMRKGFDGLAALVQTALALDPYSFRGKRGDLLKALLWDGQGLVLCTTAPGTRSLCLATDHDRHRGPDQRAAINVA